MAAYLVPKNSLQQLISSLEDAIPKSLSMISLLTNTIQGRLVANCYVDKWPDFSAIVCELIWPRRSDVADISAYATSSEALLTVLVEGNLVTWGKRQEFQRIEAVHADYLLAHLKQPELSTGLECVHERAVFCYREAPLQIYDAKSDKQEVYQKLSKMLPDGFVMGKLGPHHAEMVASQWPRLHDWPNKAPYFKELIENYNSCAIYSINNLDWPISYSVQLTCIDQLFSYTVKEYRGKGFSWITSLYCQKELFMVEKNYPVLSETAHAVRTSNEYSGRATRHGNVKDLIIKPCMSMDSKL